MTLVSTPPAKASGRLRDAGVSLVEVLVVLVLIGVMAGAIGLSLGGAGQGNAVDREARLLAARLTRAADETLLTGEPVALIWAQDRYRLARLRADQWTDFDVPQLAAEHVLPRALRLAGQGADAADGVFIVGPDLLPVTGAPLRIEVVTDGGAGVTVVFDGATALVESDA